MSAYVPEHVYHPHAWAKHQIHRRKEHKAVTAQPLVAPTKGALIDVQGECLTLDCKDRAAIAYIIERLINLLDGFDGDLDLEIEELEEQHDAEAEDAEPNGDEGDYGRCEDDARPEELYWVPFGPLTGGQGL
ncbi:MAG: hypothetical protein R3D70_14095 [Rhizobiaceae bacterium]